MALKEAQCPNCGSLLQLEDKNDQGHCLFCDAVFTSEEAFAIAANPAGVTFPNLPQPKYNGPNLNPQLTSAQINARSSQIESAKKKEAKISAKPAAPVFVPRDDIKIPDLKLSVKTRIQLSLAALLIVVVIIGISYPMITSRNKVRTGLFAAMATISPHTVNADQAVVIHGLHNQRLQLALPEAITADQAVAVFKAYSAERATLSGKDPADFADTSDDLTIKIVTPAGGFLIEKPASQAKLDDGSAVKILS